MTPSDDAKDARGEYRRWLHVFTVGKTDSVYEHMSFPWIWEEASANRDAVEALFHVTKFEGLPSQWTHEFWHFVVNLKRLHGEPDRYGPYALILPRMQLASCAAEMASYKRRLRSQIFKNPTAYGKSDAQATYDRLFWDGLQQYLFRPSTGDCADETQ